MTATLKPVGLIAGPTAAIILFFALPDHYVDIHKALIPLEFSTKATLCMTIWMAIWWLTEAIDISATALLPIALFPLLGIADIKSVTAPYANHLIFLFIGGFIIALSMQRWGLDRRIALLVLSKSHASPYYLIAGFMLVAMLLSAFITNTATTALLLPIGLSVIHVVAQRPGETSPRSARNFAICVMLGIAYAASLGGITTVIGTTPNLFLAAYIEDSIAPAYRIEIGFFDWYKMAAPLVYCFVPIVWLFLTRMLFPFDPAELNQMSDSTRGTQVPMNRGEKVTLTIFVLTILLWMFRQPLQQWTLGGQSEPLQPFASLSDSGIAMLAALLLFVTPVNWKKFEFAMDWRHAKDLPWGILILFGGGLTLASAIQLNRVAEFIGAQVSSLPLLPEVAYILIVCTMVIFLTELTSNFATTATLVPILASIAEGLGIHPYLFIFPATFAASCAFMMPIATPPNAIVFGSGYIRIGEMCRAGIWLNLIGVGLVTLLTYTIIKPALQL